MKKLLLVLLLASVLQSQTLFSEKMVDGRAGDIVHIGVSAIGTLAVQKYTGWEWGEAVMFMFWCGVLWESFDTTIGKFPFDPYGFNERDIFYNLVGCAISYPLRYRNCDIKISSNKVQLSLRF